MSDKSDAAFVANMQAAFLAQWGEDFRSMMAAGGVFLGPSPTGEYIGLEFNLESGPVRVSLHCTQIEEFGVALSQACQTAAERIAAMAAAEPPPADDPALAHLANWKPGSKPS